MNNTKPMNEPQFLVRQNRTDIKLKRSCVYPTCRSSERAAEASMSDSPFDIMHSSNLSGLIPAVFAQARVSLLFPRPAATSKDCLAIQQTKRIIIGENLFFHIAESNCCLALLCCRICSQNLIKLLWQAANLNAWNKVGAVS